MLQNRQQNVAEKGKRKKIQSLKLLTLTFNIKMEKGTLSNTGKKAKDLVTILMPKISVNSVCSQLKGKTQGNAS